jgi:hypothetical protein
MVFSREDWFVPAADSNLARHISQSGESYWFLLLGWGGGAPLP